MLHTSVVYRISSCGLRMLRRRVVIWQIAKLLSRRKVRLSILLKRWALVVSVQEPLRLKAEVALRQKLGLLKLRGLLVQPSRPKRSLGVRLKRLRLMKVFRCKKLSSRRLKKLQRLRLFKQRMLALKLNRMLLSFVSCRILMPLKR